MIKFTKVRDWGIPNLTNDDGLLLITGPCSAETEQQVMETAKSLKEKKLVTIFRAGVWKPRTRPNSFEGIGEIGLKWMQKVKNELKIPVIVEVSNPKHIDLALKYDIDILWIGARTTVNPFQIQDIADRLKGLDIPVMIKNPINADLGLWVGAIERLHKAGVNKIGAIHRGFSTTSTSHYRNPPHWEFPIELRSIFPDLPIICDPSHISGKRDLIPSVSQKALDLNLDGLMIEVHPCPEKALSDPAQQLTPSALEELICRLDIKSETSQNINYEDKMNDLRDKIDHIDKELLDCLAVRMEIINRVATCKSENNITAFQVKRLDKLLKDRITRGKELGLNEKYIDEIFHTIHTESVKVQSEYITEKFKKVS